MVLAFDDTTPKLVLLSGAPCKDVAFLVEGEDVIGACGEGGDILDIWDENGGVLDEFVGIKAKDPFVVLWMS